MRSQLIISRMTGLLLVPNGKDLGRQFGDTYPEENMNSTAIFNGNSTADGKQIDEQSIINHKVDTSTHPWGIFLTVLGTVLLDFDADACQSPSRAYLLDVCVPGMVNYLRLIDIPSHLFFLIPKTKQTKRGKSHTAHRTT